MQSNASYERSTRPARNARPPADFKQKVDRRENSAKTWTRTDAKRRQSDMLQ